GFGLIEGHCRFVDVALRVGGEVHRPFAVLLVVGSIKTIVMKMRHGETDLVKLKLKLAVLQSDLQNAVGGVLVLAHIYGEWMPRLRIGKATKPGFAAGLHACFLTLQSDVEQAIGPGSLVHAEQAL